MKKVPVTVYLEQDAKQTLDELKRMGVPYSNSVNHCLKNGIALKEFKGKISAAVKGREGK